MPMPESTSSESVRFSGPEEEQLVRYRAVSKSAVAALLLGLASVLMLINPLMILVPVIGVVCAIVALRTIRANPGEWIGKTPAIIGLVLALFFMGWGLGWSMTRPARIASHAQALADDWLKLVARRQLYAAHQLRQPAEERVPITGRFDDFYRGQPDLLRSFNEFSGDPLVEAIYEAGPDEVPEFVEIAERNSSGLDDSITFRYRLPAKGEADGRTFLLTIRRRVVEDGVQWEVNRLVWD